MAAGSSALGRATATRLIEVARKVLIQEGCANFSMRTVAINAGVRLSNLQYYFPTRDDLARALMVDTGERYRAAYVEVLSKCPDDRFARFNALMDFNLKDVSGAHVKRYFVQLWAVLLSLDDGKGAFLDELYRIDIEQLCERITELDPCVSPQECRRRATTLAAIIEGLMVTGGAIGRGHKAQNDLMQFIKGVALDIATGAAGAIRSESKAAVPNRRKTTGSGP